MGEKAAIKVPKWIKSDEAPKPRRFCVLCMHPLADGNAGDRCFHHHRIDASSGEGPPPASVSLAITGETLINLALRVALDKGGKAAMDKVGRILQEVSSACGESVKDILGGYGPRRVAFARHLVAYLIQRGLGWMERDIAEVILRDYKVAKYACARMARLSKGGGPAGALIRRVSSAVAGAPVKRVKPAGS